MNKGLGSEPVPAIGDQASVTKFFDNYGSGLTFRQAWKASGLAREFCGALLKNSGKARKGSRKWKRKPEAEQTVIALYEEGKTMLFICEATGLGYGTVNAILNAAGKTRTMSQAQRTRSLNVRAFDVLTKNTCYWLGFICAEGYVSAKDYSLAIQLSSIDREHLESLRDFIGAAEYPLISQAGGMSVDRTGRVYNGGPTTTLRVRSKELATKLVQLGLGGRSYEKKPIQELLDSPDFWRGFVDGDGCLEMRDMGAKKRKLPRVTVVGNNRGLIESFEAFSKAIFPETKAVVRKGRTVEGIRDCYTFSLTGYAAKEVVKTLHRDSRYASLRRKARTAGWIKRWEPRTT